MSIDKNDVLALLSDKPITRSELRSRLHVADEVIRRCIAELRLDGVPICSTAQKSGYWLGNAVEVRQTAKEMYARQYKLKRIADKLVDIAEGL